MFVDIIIIFLLICVFGYCYMLSTRVKALFEALQLLGPALEQFSENVDRTERSVEAMVSTAPTIAAEPAKKDPRAAFFRLAQLKGGRQ